MSDLTVPKTYKLFVGGAFVRSESGRVAAIDDPDGVTRRVATASRKDLRDAVTAGRRAQPGWQAATAYLRGQILYRIAEMADGRRDRPHRRGAPAGLDEAAAAADVDGAVATWIWWAGWCDKLTSVLGTVNPVAGPFLNVSTPEPTGVVGRLAPSAGPLGGLAEVVAPILCGGNTTVVVVSEVSPRGAHLRRGHRHLRRSGRSGESARCRRGIRCRGWPITTTSTPSTSRGSEATSERTPPDDRRRISNGWPQWRETGRREPGAYLELKTVWHPARL